MSTLCLAGGFFFWVGATYDGDSRSRERERERGVLSCKVWEEEEEEE